MPTDLFNTLLTFLHELQQRNISYTLAHSRAQAISVLVNVPGERWEIDFHNNGEIDVERFRSHGEILGEEALADLFDRYSD
jgi:hypothetical protein